MKILLAEDSAVYRHLITAHLKRWGFDLTVATDGAEAWELLQRPDAAKLALLDWVLPKLDGIELCQRIRSRSDADSYVYTVLLTGKNERKDLLQALAAGADDYLAKPFDELELKARLFAGKRILELQEQLVSARESLRFGATHDSLTGLLNRSEVLGLLRKEIARASREQQSIGIALADIDHFKKVNDTFGHLAGDKILQETAQRLSSKLRVYDGVGRYGGEEFLLVFAKCGLKTTLERANEIREHVAHEVIKDGSIELRVTVSMGVTAVAHGRKDVRLETVLQQADVALYQAKTKGRNRVESFIRAGGTDDAGRGEDRALRSQPPRTNRNG